MIKSRKKSDKTLGVLIFLLIFIFPVGLIFLGYRIEKEKEYRISSGVILLSIGVPVFLIAFCAFISGFLQPWDTRADFLSDLTTSIIIMIIVLFFIIPGVFLLQRGISDRRLIRLVNEEQFEDPEDLSLLMCKSVKRIKKQAERLQKEKRLDNPAIENLA